ncbi:MAG: flagellar hook capping FlgD N-terminal domain-containing protein [Anaerolineaceae bacterium]
MTAINELSAYKYTATSNTSETTAATSSKNEETDAFMGLLLAQMRNQSPMDPMDDNQMISQMAQLNSLQELQSISAALTELTQSNRFLSATNLIGKKVGYSNEDSESINGLVSSVFMEGDDIMLTVGNDDISISDVIEVSEG